MSVGADSPGMWFEGLPQDKVGRVLQTLLPEPTDAEPGFRAPQLDKKLERLVHPTPPLTLFVCASTRTPFVSQLGLNQIIPTSCFAQDITLSETLKMHAILLLQLRPQ